MKKPIIVIFITIFIDMLGFGIIIPILPVFTKELGAENYQVGLIAMSYAVMNFIFAPFWGSLSDSFGRRPIILGSVLITGCAYLLFSQTTNLWLLLLSRIFAGIGSANLSVAQAYIADITTPEQRAKSMGMIGAAFGLGFIIGPTVGGYLKAMSGVGHMDAVGYTAAGLCLMNLVLAYFLLPESLQTKKEHVRFNFKVISGVAVELRKPTIRELLLINFIFITAFMIMQMSATLYWKEQIGLSEIEIGNMFAFIGLATVIVQGGLVGRLVKRFGETRLMKFGMGLFIVGLMMIPWATRETFLPIELTAFALIALANGCLTPSITSLLSKKADARDVGQVLGVNQSFGSMARAVGMGLSGFIYGVEFHLPFITGAAIMLTCFYLYSLLQGRSAPV
jgi:DHA1 family tetracycline resistance protein-like MFS transporter